MELIKDSIAVEESVYTEQSQILVDGDIIVPDVKPDILKIVQVDAMAVVTDKEVTDGRIMFNGCVNLKIMYIPDRENENVKSITTSFDFTHKAEKQAIQNGMIPNVCVDVDRVEFRLINSRKLSVKTIVGADICICGNKNIDVVTAVEAENKVEVMQTPIKINAVAADCERELVIKESMEVPTGKTSISEILKADAKISDKEIKAVTGKAVVKGVVNTSILYVGDNNSIEFIEYDIPFTEVFDISNVGEGIDCEIDYTICDLYYDTTQDNDGDNRIVNLEFVVSAKIKATESLEINIVSDCYSPGLETELVREEVMLDEIVCQPKSQNTIREIVPIDKNAPQIMGIYYVITKANVTNTNIERGKLSVEGKIESYILYLSDSTEIPVYSYKKEIPFNYMMESPNSESGMDCEVKAEIEHTSYNLNASSEVELRIILSVNAKITNKRTLNLITDAQTSEVGHGQKKGIVIYFVQSGDTLWDIAKRYKVALDDIIEFNEITDPDKLSIGKQLIIPSGM